MTEKEKQTALAEALGWTKHDIDDTGFTCKRCRMRYSSSIWREWEIPLLWCKKDGNEYPPDFDLDEIRAAELLLLDSAYLQDEYLNTLVNVVHKDAIDLDGSINDRNFPVVCATASQRHEALLRVIGKWKE